MEATAGDCFVIDDDDTSEPAPISLLTLIVFPEEICGGTQRLGVYRAKDGVELNSLPDAERVSIFRASRRATDISASLNPAKIRPGSHCFVRMPGEPFLRVGTASGSFNTMSGHAVLSGGKPVLMAGELEVDDNSRLIRWSNVSGTFRPSSWAASAALLDPARFIPYVGKSRQAKRMADDASVPHLQCCDLSDSAMQTMSSRRHSTSSCASNNDPMRTSCGDQSLGGQSAATGSHFILSG